MDIPSTLNVYALPELASPDDLAGQPVVVIDVLRASTTIAYALEAGAKEVIPALHVEEAQKIASEFPAGQAVLGGERNGVLIHGFDLANSPEEYTSERVAGRTLVFTTTNGTAAIVRVRCAGRILLGAFVNVTAVFRQLAGRRQVHLVCAGTHGHYSSDDVLLAGMLVERLVQHGEVGYQQNAQAITAREFWLSKFTSAQALGDERLEPRRLAEVLQSSAGGKHLLALGLEKDILAAAQVDRFSPVPELDPASLRIRLSEPAGA